MNRLAELIADYNAHKRDKAEPLMTQRRLAALVGLHEVTVSRHVKGGSTLDLAQAAAYARALRVEIGDLLEPAA